MLHGATLRFRRVVAPGAERAIGQLDQFVAGCGLEPGLIELVRVRASQLNGCVYCIDMHTKDARARGDTEQRLHALSAWREAPYFTDRERAALAWTEAVTLVSEGHVPDAASAETRAQFTEAEIAGLPDGRHRDQRVESCRGESTTGSGVLRVAARGVVAEPARASRRVIIVPS
jgi:AhpD family alkylhydroperoxidase